jgi:hypothetical protein
VPSSAPKVGPLDRLVTLPTEVPKLTLGWEAVRWAAKYLRQPNGPKAGQRFEFVPSQVQFLLHWYGLDENGEWLYRRAVRRLSKGSGKSPFAALMALLELCGPVRLDRWDPDAPGGCVGKPVSMPWVQIAATAESQTENTMRMVRAFAPKGSRIVADYGLDPGKTMYYARNGGKLHVLTSSAHAADGAEATFVVGDEPEHWLPGNRGPEFAATLADNLAKSGSRMLETCNAWQPGAGSVAEASWDAWVAQEEGKHQGKSKILYDARIAPPLTREQMQDESTLMDALRFVYGDCWWVALESIKERVWDSAESDARRKYLNQPVADERAWVTPQEWSALTRPHVEFDPVQPGEQIVMFFDGSKSRDATALIGCRMSDGHVFAIDVWEPDTVHNTDDVVDAMAVDSAVARAFETYSVVAFFADVAEWEGFVKVTWPKLYADQLMVWASPGSREPAPIAWDMRSRRREFGDACETCHAEIVDRQFTHDGDSRVARHVNNARMVERDGRTGIAKESPSSSRKIDGAVCVVGARMARRIVLASKEWEKSQHRGAGRGRVVVLS